MTSRSQESASSVRIETERLIIRDVQLEDTAAMHVWRSDPEVAKWMNFEPASDIETKAFVVQCVSVNETEPDVHSCSIVHKTTNTVIGWIGWGPPAPGKAAFGDADFGYALRRDAWDRGYGTEVLHAVIDHVLNKLGVKCFFGETDVRNTRSARVMEKAGMEPMGIAPWDETSLWFRVRQL